MNSIPIGIIDSGSGGLSIWKEITRLLPGESTVYIGDHANLPYSDKSTEFIRHRVFKLIQLLITLRVKLIVIACNTATVAGIDWYREQFPDIPIIGVVPVIKTAAEVSKTKHTASQLHFSLVNIESEKRRLSSSINETDARIKSIEHHIIAQSRDNINPAQQKNLMAQKQKLLNDKKNYLKQLEAKETEMKRMDGALRKVIKGQNSIVAKISKRKPNFIDFIQPYLKSMGYWLYHKTKTKSSKNDN